ITLFVNCTSLRGSEPFDFIVQICCPKSANPETFRNATCEPSGETVAENPSSLNCLGVPPRIDTVHKVNLPSGEGQDANNCELSGSHVSPVTSRSFGSSGCISPVPILRR